MDTSKSLPGARTTWSRGDLALNCRIRSYWLLLLASAFCLFVLTGAGRAVRVIGRPAPDLTIDTLLQAPEGTTTTLEALRGKAVVLEFWATWCQPCVEGIPHLNELAGNMKDKPVQFIAVTSEDPATVKPFLSTHQLNAWVGCDLDHSLEQDYRVVELPICFLIDTTGTLKGMADPARLNADVLERLFSGEPLNL